MNKLYTRIEWENFPSEKTALNESNLNRMDLALDNLDNRAIEIDATKVNKEVANNLVKTWSIDEETGIITVEHLDGSKDLFDLNIEKIPVNFELSDDGILTMTTDDGSKFTANIGAMIPVLTFEDSDTIAVSVSGEGVNKTYSFSIKSGSVTEDKLQPNFLADTKLAASRAETARDSAILSQEKAVASENNAKSSENTAKSYAIGNTGTRAGEDTDNAKYYKEQTDVSLGASEQIKRDVAQMKSDVSDIKSQVEQDKADIDETIKNSLLEKSEEILDAMKDYFNRAQQLYNSMYIDCDGEKPQQRVVTIVSIDCGTPQSRLHDDNGILFDGGTPLNRQLAS